MTAMSETSESFVDLSYRGLALGKRVKLTQVRPTTGYLEVPAPMPVGTAIAIATDDGVLIEASVAEIHEQVGGSEHAPGMLVRPKLDADIAQQWWSARASGPELAEPAQVEIAQPVGTVLPKRMTGAVDVPALADDGRTTAVMEAVDPDAALPAPSPPVEDDAKHTIAMAAVDLAALGLEPAQSGEMPAAGDDDDGDKPDKAGGRRKRRKAR